MLRIGLYLLTNFLVLMVAGFVLNVLGAFGLLGEEGSGAYTVYLVYAAVFGFGGSFISLALSKTIAKWSTGARVIERPQNKTEPWLMQSVVRQAQAAGSRMPEVAIYDAPDERLRDRYAAECSAGRRKSGPFERHARKRGRGGVGP